MPERSDPTSDAEILRNVVAPRGFGRRRAVCIVAAPPRYSGIAIVAAPCIQPGGAPNATRASFSTGC